MSAIQILLDVLMLKTNAQIDKKSDERGLNVTLDGVHLNTAGADMVASKFMDVILSEGG
jgi:lysophospholipase L1-like esterase